MDCHHRGVVPFLGAHLKLLDLADSVLGIEYNDPCAGHICKSGHGRLARIPGCGRENDDFPVHMVLPGRCRHKVRQDGQSHVLECYGASMVQFKIICPVSLCQRRYLLCIKLAVIGPGNTVL